MLCHAVQSWGALRWRVAVCRAALYCDASGHRWWAGRAAAVQQQHNSNRRVLHPRNIISVWPINADGDSEEGVAAVLGTIRPASGSNGEDTSSTDEEVAANPTGEPNDLKLYIHHVFFAINWVLCVRGGFEMGGHLAH